MSDENLIPIAENYDFLKARDLRLRLARQRPGDLSPTFGGTGTGGGGTGGAKKTGTAGRQFNPAHCPPIKPERTRMPEMIASRLAQAMTFGQACAAEGKVFAEKGAGRRLRAKDARAKSSKKGGGKK